MLGLIVATILTTALLPVRLSEGQGKDPVNLIGSQTVIWCLWFFSWAGSHYIQRETQFRNWQKVALSVLLCMVLSIVLYHSSNPFFEDYPNAPIRNNTFWVGIMRLSIRGMLVSAMLVPFIFYIHYQRTRQNEKLELQQQHAREIERRNELLEQTVSERTADLEKTLHDLHESQRKLDNQIYLQSRLLASITHDVQAPMNYVSFTIKYISACIQNGQFEHVLDYIQAVENAVGSMSLFMGNLLEFSKTQIKDGGVNIKWINLRELLIEKAALYEGIVASKNNHFQWEVSDEIEVKTNSNLFAIVLHNLFDNATKYSENSRISIYTDTLDEQICLCIENHGKEMPQSIVQWLNGFEQSAKQDAQVVPLHEVGVGLLLVRDITALLNMRFFIRAEPGKIKACLILQSRRTLQMVS